MADKCFIITGASSGLGKSIKDLLLSSTSHHVVSLSRKHEESDLLNTRISFYECDFSFLPNLDFIDSIYEKYCHYEIIFINNAATILPLKCIGSFKEEEIFNYIKINTISPIKIINRLVSIFNKSKISVINITSGAAKKPISYWSLYCSSKSAVHMFCEVLAVEHPSLVVRNIDPGVIDTQMQNKIRESSFPDVGVFSKLAETGKLKRPIDVAREILVLLE